MSAIRAIWRFASAIIFISFSIASAETVHDGRVAHSWFAIVFVAFFAVHGASCLTSGAREDS